MDMDMEMSGVAAWSFFCIDTPQEYCLRIAFLQFFFSFFSLSDRSISTFVPCRVAILKIPNI